MRVLGGDGVVRPCYRLPGHVVMVLEEGERGQVQNCRSLTGYGWTSQKDGQMFS